MMEMPELLYSGSNSPFRISCETNCAAIFLRSSSPSGNSTASVRPCNFHSQVLCTYWQISRVWFARIFENIPSKFLSEELGLYILFCRRPPSGGHRQNCMQRHLFVWFSSSLQSRTIWAASLWKSSKLDKLWFNDSMKRDSYRSRDQPCDYVT